jgi:flagellar basal-body rod modification protein FlgD
MQGVQQVATSALDMAKSAATTAVANTASASAASTDNSTITANDFLTLLVTEMKNQDPTQPTDPNAYIQQLVQVNSLQQLIGINQGITSLDTAAGTETGATGAV